MSPPARFRIHCSLLLLGTGGLARILAGPSAFALSVATALLLLILLMVIHSRGLIGGGDVKIMTALAVGLSPFDCYRFVVATAIAGGILAIAYLLLSPRLPVCTGQDEHRYLVVSLPIGSLAYSPARTAALRGRDRCRRHIRAASHRELLRPCRSVSSSSGLLLLTALGLGLVGYQATRPPNDGDSVTVSRGPAPAAHCRRARRRAQPAGRHVDEGGGLHARVPFLRPTCRKAR